jgi:hypothetical protein
LIEAIENYSPQICQIFDFESVLHFIKNIDGIAKEKATQVLEHFKNQSKIEKFLILGNSWEGDF